ncbi:S8 family serine peptidase [Bradyrhizobium sp. USDA 4519]|nr:subtilisin family serine protease [Bradyrhizobium sp. USDA 4541]
MSDANGKMRFLVKAPGSLRAASIGLAQAPAVKLTVKPLFQSIGKGGGLGAAAPAEWHMVEADAPQLDVAAAWQACHELVAQGQALAPGGIRFAEPDLEQQWPIGKEPLVEDKLALRTGAPNDQDPHYPREADNYWFADNDHGQFSALVQSDPGKGHRIRIAHLDTGFDPDHVTCPKFIDGQKNFVDPDFPDDARDRSSGLFNNFSHGTGTLSILAGGGGSGVKPFGCAPDAEIVPIRVANRVILFRNSAIAQAFDHVHGLCRTPSTFVHVVTMSMGGVPSQAWAEAVNALYDAGVFVVTAAGNNYGNFPTHLIVYPARFNRVVAACGVMADGAPYADLAPALMAGDYGPDSKMLGALAAYTPNVPWARFGEAAVVDFDGAGTSAATPQIAAAAATWIQANRPLYDGVAEPWQRVELIRNALFESAAHDQTRAKYLGAGRLRAKDASTWIPRGGLEKQPEDDASFSMAHLVFGLAAAGPLKQPMLDLELCQVLQKTGLDSKLTGRPARGALEAVVAEVLASPLASHTLKKALMKAPVVATSARAPASAQSAAITPMDHLNLEQALEPPLPVPPVRKLRVFAYDPTLQTDPQMFGINEATVSVPWEAELTEGPTGEYLEVVDVDPASKCCYAPVDLNHPHLLGTNGHAPSEANPQFHQQMAYAVAMRTITRFERALGRRALWAPRMVRGPDGNVVDRKFVQRLRVYPHALRENNAYYSSARMALLFGYFTAEEGDIGTSLPGSQVFCSVSHDIIAHETTHALLDGLHPRYQEATNPDMLAFHEAFADIVALFQHFTIPEALLQQIKRARGDLSQESLLGQLAVQFGQASGMHGPLRSAIGRTDEKGEWQAVKPSRTDYETQKATGDPHLLGSVLVSAVFAAFETIYRGRSADLVRLATNGTGILPQGEISHDLALRLAAEASTIADQVLNICIRALDYCPPTDLTFGEYLRALITGDRDLVREDTRGYRVAFISAFRDRGIYPKDVAHLAEDSLVWRRPPAIDHQMARDFAALVKSLDLDWNLNSLRRNAYDTSERNRLKVWKWISDPKRAALLSSLGFENAAQNVRIGEMVGEMRPVEVHSVRPSRKTAPDGTSHGWLVMGITQTFRAHPDAERYRGGCTVMVDLNDNMPVYFIRKCLRGSTGAVAQRQARLAAKERAAELGIAYVSPGDPHHDREQFALLHRGWGT